MESKKESMSPSEFVKKYTDYALQCEVETKVPADFILAQSALETGWGRKVVGNMMFGIKDTDGVNGNEQLLTTTEYHNSPNFIYPIIYSITQVGKKLWKYKIKDWFRKYPTPYESFKDHAKFLVANKRYKNAFKYTEPRMFAKAVAVAGYATDPTYAEKLIAIIDRIQKERK